MQIDEQPVIDEEPIDEQPISGAPIGSEPAVREPSEIGPNTDKDNTSTLRQTVDEPLWKRVPKSIWDFATTNPMIKEKGTLPSEYIEDRGEFRGPIGQRIEGVSAGIGDIIHSGMTPLGVGTLG